MHTNALRRPRKAVFFHVLKTGGMTFRGILSSIYGDAFHVCGDPSIDAIIGALARFDCLEFHTLPYRGDFVHMHAELARRRRWDLLAGCDVFAMFRDPVDQAISQYFYMVEKRDFIEPAYRANGVPFPESLEQYAESPWHFNNQLAFLIGKYQLASKEPLRPQDLAEGKDVLLRLQVHAGLMERYADALHVFETVTSRQIPGRRIENRNQNPRRLPLGAIPAAIKEQIRRQSSLDIELYEFARTLFEKDIAECGLGLPYNFGNVLRNG
jgi:hypothetical protein